MQPPRLLDLFCGAGGAGMGYHRAGWEVIGVDIKPQPRYPFTFHQSDAMLFPLDGFDAIHASPPCQAYSPLNARVGYRHTLDLVAPVRERLIAACVPWVMENVPASPVVKMLLLCGTMFNLRTYRHRYFESSELLMAPGHPRHTVRASTKERRKDWDAGLFISVTGDVGVFCGPDAMGIDWMTGRELSQAIPPAYTEYIGRQLMAVFAERSA